MKACCLSNEQVSKFGLLVGSGNFSRRGLVDNTECGIAVFIDNDDEFTNAIEALFDGMHLLWDAGDPLADVLARYKALWRPAQLDVEDRNERERELEPQDFEHFWIDVGYVTRNRGPDTPGNQIDMPRRVHRFFGLNVAANQARNSVIGDVTFIGRPDPLVRRLRLGNNSMEKITLPLPEDYDFGAYDGKVLEFTRVPGGFAIRAFEIEEYKRLLERSRGSITREMGSGRLYGFR